MAPNTSHSCRNLVIYEVYVRNHGPNGTFADVEADLPRLKALGVDVVWFMPIHPIGKLNRKGSHGSPYSIQDYRGVNPEYGSREDFTRLIERAHALGLKVMIDVVYNHTSHDSVLVKEHPEYFNQDAQGHPVTTVPDWSDVIDLKHPNPALTDYLVDTLVMWAQAGVDGFRCDVAPLVPIDFWQQARAAVEKARPGVIWLAESVHGGFIDSRRRRGLFAQSDSEIYAAFDLCYDYEIWPVFQQAVQGACPVLDYLEMLRFQDFMYPENYVKMRCVENHDNWRILRLAPSRDQALAWTAFSAFNRGAFLIYGGQEAGAEHTPSLFEVDKIDWKDYPSQDFLSKLAHLKKDPAQVEGQFILLADAPAIQAAWQHPSQSLYGIFNTTAAQGEVGVQLADGKYADLINGGEVTVKKGKTTLPAQAAILRCAGLKSLKMLHCPLLDYHPQ